MTRSVGQRLRAARQQQRLDFETLVARTKIQEKFLRAIETDDRSAFPSGFFYKSFVDQYAAALSVDPRELAEAIRLILSNDAPLPLPGEGNMPIRRVQPLVIKSRPSKMRVVASIGTLAIVLVGCSAFYSWWKKISNPVSAKARAEIAKQVATPAAATPAEAEHVAPAAEPVKTASQSQVASVQFALKGPEVQEVSAPPDAAKSARGLLLELLARRETWLSISSDGQMVFKGTLGPNESKKVEGREFAKLRVNNPEALEVKLNGKTIGPLGQPGQYVIVVFTRDTYHVLDSSKESD